MSVSRGIVDAAALAASADLALLAKTVVEGSLAGLHLDLRPGAGMAFRQYRPYLPGDDLRRVDWQVYARSDRLMVREAEVDREMRVRILLDASLSMASTDPASGRAGPAPSKLDYARRLAACIAYLLERQGDRLEVHALTGGRRQDLVAAQGSGRVPRSRSGSPGLAPLCTRLAQLEPAGRWPAWSALAPILAGPGHARELTVVLSDLYQQRDEVRATLRGMAAAGCEILVVQMLGRAELELSWHGDVMFEDLESGETVRTDADALRPIYRRRLRAMLGAWRRQVLDLGGDYHLLITDQPLAEALRVLLTRRLAARGGRAARAADGGPTAGLPAGHARAPGGPR